MELKGLSRADALKILSKEFSVPIDNELVRAAILAEHVRTVVYSSTEKIEPGISSIKLSSLIRRNLKGIVGDEFSFDTDIGKLAAVGDIYRHDARWLPLLERAIQIDEGHILIVGAAPTSLLSNRYELSISSLGHLRVAKIERPLGNGALLTMQDFDSWLGIPYGDLNCWAKSYVHSVTHQMLSDIPPGEFFWYDGWGWRGLEKYRGDEHTLLLGRRHHFWEKEYCFITAARIDGEVRPTKCHRMSKDVGKRLRLAYGKEKKIKIGSTSDFFYFDWRGALPQPEAKILHLASKLKKKEDEFIQYEFAKEVWPLVDKFLSRLGFSLIYNNED